MNSHHKQSRGAERLRLSNRPRLSVPSEKLESVVAGLAGADSDRRSFMTDPTSYLRQTGVALGHCDLIDAPERRLTSEVCTLFAICFVAVGNGVVAVNLNLNWNINTTQNWNHCDNFTSGCEPENQIGMMRPNDFGLGSRYELL